MRLVWQDDIRPQFRFKIPNPSLGEKLTTNNHSPLVTTPEPCILTTAMSSSRTVIVHGSYLVDSNYATQAEGRLHALIRPTKHEMGQHALETCQAMVLPDV